jgi:hypothetical protein
MAKRASLKNCESQEFDVCDSRLKVFQVSEICSKMIQLIKLQLAISYSQVLGQIYACSIQIPL